MRRMLYKGHTPRPANKVVAVQAREGGQSAGHGAAMALRASGNFALGIVVTHQRLGLCQHASTAAGAYSSGQKVRVKIITTPHIGPLAGSQKTKCSSGDVELKWQLSDRSDHTASILQRDDSAS